MANRARESEPIYLHIFYGLAARIKRHGAGIHSVRMGVKARA
jgi:hypothetical protein